MICACKKEEENPPIIFIHHNSHLFTGDVNSFYYSDTIDKDPSSITWDFGDGTPNVSGFIVEHTYSSPGEYQMNARGFSTSLRVEAPISSPHTAALAGSRRWAGSVAGAAKELGYEATDTYVTIDTQLSINVQDARTIIMPNTATENVLRLTKIDTAAKVLTFSMDVFARTYLYYYYASDSAVYESKWSGKKSDHYDINIHTQ
ncbi:hypothetical protein GCM10023093_29630 [Nemorincola caseinilytica]|uniref:PKD domain-containing protein n=2 Tax=Nemorincola caseinilytica TaxID=2054315 RepID=A0ABP8NME6_9BACT